MTVEQFNNVKKGDKFQLIYSDAFMARDKETTIVATSKARSLRNGKIHRVTLKREDNPTGCKYHIYLRDGKTSLSYGDSALSKTTLKQI